MKRLVLLSGLLLSACALPVTPDAAPISQPQPMTSSSSHSFSSLLSLSSASRSSVFRQNPSHFLPSTTTGSTLERAADGGILEVGLDDAPLLIVFTNYSCDYCSQFMMQDFPRLLREYVDPGKLKVRIVSVPLIKYKTSAGEASALACATTRAKGMQMHNKLLTAAKRDRAGILQLGVSIKITAKEMGACMDAQTTKDQLAIQKTLIDEHDVALVPSFVLGTDKRVGYPSYADLRGWLEERLR